MKLSIFLAGIRPQNWLALYNSIPDATALPKEEYELVIVSPYDLPPELQKVDNVRWIEDRGCPTRCYQLGALHSRGEYVLWVADDGTFNIANSIDDAFAVRPNHRKGIATLRYLEGTPNKIIYRKMQDPGWWNIGHHPMLVHAPYAPNNYLLIMLGLMSRDYLMEIGGWDCRFEHVGLGCVDLSIRLQNDGAEVILGEKMMDISMLPGRSGDHGPIRDAHKSDKGLFNQMYHSETGKGKSKIDFDNWKLAPEVWPRRFGGPRGDKTGPGHTEPAVGVKTGPGYTE